MVGIGAKVFKQEQDLKLARRLMEGCLWGYEVMPQGIMPEMLGTRKSGTLLSKSHTRVMKAY